MPKRTEIKFFQDRMSEHSCVESCNQIESQGGYVFELQRTNDLSPVRVHLSDAYDYGLAEYAARPAEIGRGDFILLGGFATNFQEDLVILARNDRIGIGTIRKLMGALNYAKVWEYELPEERNH